MKHLMPLLLFVTIPANAAVCKLNGSYHLLLSGGVVYYGETETRSLEDCVALAKRHLGERIDSPYGRTSITKLSFRFDDGENVIRGTLKKSFPAGRKGD
ncbi:MAG: hypothetical protein HY074_17470 [Deltaproteobacteria bacterium]|nr:hypothetical protein [Deltaproteobacteria bacterium]